VDQYVACPYNFPAQENTPDWTCGASDTVTFHEDGRVEYRTGASPETGTWGIEDDSSIEMNFQGSFTSTLDRVKVRNNGRIVLTRVGRMVNATWQTTEAENAFVLVSGEAE
jgi:hypothetical protein